MRQDTVYCKSCGAMIIFHRTKRGKQMPCNTPSVSYVADPRGTDTIMTFDGEIERGYILHDGTENDARGYVPHFATCKNPQAKKPKKQKAKTAPPPQAAFQQMATY